MCSPKLRSVEVKDTNTYSSESMNEFDCNDSNILCTLIQMESLGVIGQGEAPELIGPPPVAP